MLLRTSYRYGVFLEYYFKLQFSASWSIHGNALSWENTNFKMYPSKINWTSFRKKLTSHPLENLEHPDKKLNSLGIILIPWENLKPIEKYQPPTFKKSQSTRKTSFIVKVSTTQKSLNHHEKASTPTLENFLISQKKILIPLWKFFNSLEVTSRTPLMRKSQFHISKNNLKLSRKNLILPEKFYPFPLPA